MKVNENHPAFRPGICGKPHPRDTYIICSLKPGHHDKHYNVSYNRIWLNILHPPDLGVKVSDGLETKDKVR